MRQRKVSDEHPNVRQPVKFGRWTRSNSKRKLFTLFVVSMVFSVGLMMLLFSCVSIRMCPETKNEFAKPLGKSDSDGLGSFVVVTAASAKFFDRLKNFVGSMRYWEPGQDVVVFDLGLTREQTLEAMCWRNVAVRPFLFDKYPMHVRNVYNYAWKALLIAEIADEYDTVLVLDSGVEVRQPLVPIKAILKNEGCFIATQSNVVTAKTHNDMFERLGVVRSERFTQPFCSGGIQGYVSSSEVYQKIKKRVVKCALDEQCIAPVGSGRSNHNYDQSLLSIVAIDEGVACTKDRNFFEGNMAFVTLDETERNSVVLALRRWKIPKPYVKYLADRSTTCARDIPYDKSVEYGIIETTQSFRVDAKSKLQLCLQKYKNDRTRCALLIQEASRIPSTDLTTRAEQVLRYVYVLLQKSVLCTRTYLLVLPVFGLLLLAWMIYSSNTTKNGWWKSKFKYMTR